VSCWTASSSSRRPPVAIGRAWPRPSDCSPSSANSFHNNNGGKARRSFSTTVFFIGRGVVHDATDHGRTSSQASPRDSERQVEPRCVQCHRHFSLASKSELPLRSLKPCRAGVTPV